MKDLTPEIKETIKAIESPEGSYRMTPKRINAVLEFLDLPFHVEAKGKSGNRTYRIINQEGQGMTFNNMSSLIKGTPLGEAIITTAKTELQQDQDFWKDILSKKSTKTETVERFKGRKAA